MAKCGYFTNWTAYQWNHVLYCQDKHQKPHEEKTMGLLLFFRKETVPLIGDIPGLEQFQGPVQHSHDFRTADRYKDQTVLCVGSGPSVMDISGIVATQAAKLVRLI